MPVIIFLCPVLSRYKTYQVHDINLGNHQKNVMAGSSGMTDCSRTETVADVRDATFQERGAERSCSRELDL